MTATAPAGKTKDSAIATKRCMTPEFRVSFPSMFKPKAFEGQEAKFGLTMLFPKTTDLKELKRAAFNAAVEKWGTKDKWPKNLRLPFRDGNEKADMEGYKDTTFVSATSKQQPGLVNKAVEEIISEAEFYPGCYARATLIAFAYDQKGNKGVSFSLQNVQKIRDGKSFSGRRKASDEFDAVDSGDDDGLGGMDGTGMEEDDGLGM
jgi:hypothetical protein